jgi:hypothetical protein
VSIEEAEAKAKEYDSILLGHKRGRERSIFAVKEK